MDNLLRYIEVFKKEPVFVDEEHIERNGAIYPFEMTLSKKYPDDVCMRVQIKGKYYYFG